MVGLFGELNLAVATVAELLVKLRRDIERKCDDSSVAHCHLEYARMSAAEVLVAAKDHYRLPARADIPADSLPDALRRARDVIRPEPIDWKILDERGAEWMRYWDENVRGRH